MKLISLHIDNFGKFNNLNISFNDGLNQFIEENGWGKSTLTAFIKVMFYGFDNSSKRDFYENEKKRYKPWNGGVYGGNITFLLDNKSYTIYRTFETKDKDDTFRLIDQQTKLASLDYSSNIGYEIFKIDSDTFKKTLCIYENNCLTESTGDIEALLGNEQSDTKNVNNFDKVIKNMDARLNALSPDRKTGELYKRKEKLNTIQAELKEIPILEASIDTTISYIKDNEENIKKLSYTKQHIKEELDKASYYNETQGILKQYNIYSRQLEEKKQAYEEKLEEYGRLPDITDVYTNIQYADKALDKYSQLKELNPGRAQYERLYKLKAEVSGYSHYEIKEQLDNINHLKDIKAAIQSNASVNDKRVNPLLITAIAACLLFIITGAITGAGILLIPVGIIFIIAGIVYNKRKTANNTHINELKNDYKKQYLLIKQWLDTHDIDFGPDVVYILSAIDNRLYEYEEILQQINNYNTQYKQADINGYIRKISSFIASFDNYLPPVLTNITTDDSNNQDVILLIKECSNCLYKMQQNIEIIGHIRKEYDDAYNAFDLFVSQHKDIDKILSQKSDDMLEQSQNVSMFNSQLDDIAGKLEQYNNDILDYTTRLNTYQDKLDELTDKKNILSGLKEEYDICLKNYNNLKLAREYLIKARISFSCKYQVSVNNKFNEYIDICNNITDSHDKYSFDVNNQLLKNEYGQERELRFFSSGSKDVASLCLRFAFINAMYKDDKPFIIMDDPFVNMDNNIINGAKALINTLTKDYQIIYFTCHPSRTIKNGICV